MRTLCTASVVTVLAVLPMGGHAARFQLTLDLENPTSAEGFGGSVAGLENRIVIGAGSEPACGAVLVYDAVTGVLVRSLGELPCEYGGGLGRQVAAAGQRIAVAARFLQRVNVFDADGRLERVLSPPGLAPDDYGFGTSMAIAERLVVVGGARTGVYVFDMASGEMRLLLTSPVAGPEGFGATVGFSAGKVFVGDPDSGTVYGFDGVSGELRWRRLMPKRPERVFGFGRALSADADRVAVGGATSAGGRELVLVLDTRTGVVRHRYRAPRARSGFGEAVALSGDLLLVGAPFEKQEQGAAYLYRLGRARPVASFRVERPTTASTGRSVAFSGERVVVGAPEREHVGVFTPAKRSWSP